MRYSLITTSLALSVTSVAATKDTKYYSQLRHCPQLCSEVGSNPANWTVYGSKFFEETALCTSTMLLDFNVHNDLDDPETSTKILACDTGNGNSGKVLRRYEPRSIPALTHKRTKRAAEDLTRDACDGVKQKAQVSLKFSAGSNPASPHQLNSKVKQMGGDIAEAAKRLQAWLHDPSNCHVEIAFAKSGSAVIGAYIGSKVSNPSAAEGLVQSFTDAVAKKSMSGNGGMLQFCGESTSEYTLGVIANTNDDLLSVQKAVKSWSDAKCVKASGSEAWPKTTFAVNGEIINPNEETVADPTPSSNATASVAIRSTSTTESGKKLTPSTTSTQIKASHIASSSGSTSVATSSSAALVSGKISSHSLVKRGTCSNYVQVASGDSCWSLTSKCGVSKEDFDAVHASDSSFCPGLQPGMTICCTPGDPPDMRPKPNADGTCNSYLVANGDFCAKIAAANGLKVEDLESLNKNTWGWSGCKRLYAQTNICLSKGRPPMPQPISNAICGPQVAGTKPPKGNETLADLNQCPLKACCNIWGQCGTTNEFCTESKSETGAPATAKQGENGCVSNCGTNWVLDNSPAPNFMSVAYFEAWNSERPCLKMNVQRIDPKKYTHVHYSFGAITKDYDVDISRVRKQWDSFKNLQGVKRILSFGGWSFSTNFDTFPIFRQGVTDANRQTFANNVARFISREGIDGVDFDWEYPGAPDIRGDDGPLPPGSKEDGPNYVKFLHMVRNALPEGKSLSIAAPASYWYLKGFDPIDKFAEVIDYMIYMTYDLHGQWDYGNKWSNPGCPAGNCLRSHVNMTETMNALAMVTKAGMPSHKIIVGVTSYGRSFGMAQQGCTGEMCPFGGPQSTASKGRCTGTAGYISNFELNEILRNDGSAKTWYDDDSNSDIMTYGGNWVSYMSDKTKDTRKSLYEWFNFGGTSDWAVDLQDDVGMYKPIPLSDMPPDCDAHDKYDTVDSVENDKGNIPDNCMNEYIIAALDKELKTALRKFDDIMKGDYDKRFLYYAGWIRDQLPGSLYKYMQFHTGEQFVCEHKKQKLPCCHQMGCNVNPDCNPNVEMEPWGCPYTNKWDNGKDDPGELWFHPKISEEALAKDMLEKAGIQPDWWHYSVNPWGPGLGCGRCFHNWNNYPAINTFDKVEVPNPTKMISEALKNYWDMSEDLEVTALLVQYGFDEGRSDDVIEGMELAVSIAMSAVDAMAKVSDIGKDVHEQKRQEMIWGWIMMSLLLVPVLGEAAEAGGALAAADILALAGAAGNLGAGIYGVVSDHKSAESWVGLFGALAGVRGPKGRSSSYEEAAAIRRGMGSKFDDVATPFLKGRATQVRGLKKCGF